MPTRHQQHVTMDAVLRGVVGAHSTLAPVDWNIRPLGAFCSTYSGGTPPTARREFYGGTIPWITSGDLNTPRITTVLGRITQAGFDCSSAKTVGRGDIVLALYGATAGIVAISEIEGAINQAVLAIRTTQCNREYLFQYLTNIRDSLVATYTQGGQPNLRGDIIRSLPIAIPPSDEQDAIAAALSDVDELCRALDALIAKKQAIKRAAIQQLLTGKTRLPGFTTEWTTRLLGDICTFLPTASNPRSDLDDSGDIEYIHYGDVHAHPQPVLNCANHSLPRIATYRVGNATPLRDGDLVMVDASEDLAGVGKSVEIQEIAAKVVVAGLHTILCRGDESTWATGFKAYLQFLPSFRSNLTRLAAGTSVYAVSARQLAGIEIRLPSRSEQAAIVSVLSDINAENRHLELRRDKVANVKRGMMQQLLTGRVRLVEPAATAAP